jgi:Flp pilus assembly protein TadD
MERPTLRAVSTDRLAQLQDMLAAEPGEPFLRYAIALEHKRRGDMAQAAADLEALLRDEPKYIAAYHQLALVLADLGRVEDAVHSCETGALHCLATGDRKARAELLELKNALLGDDD